MTRILHSFPTRRSSDLSEVIPLLLFWGHLNSCPFLVTLRGSRQSRTRYRRMKQSIGKDFSRTLAQRDRKSTRLNSSHLGISYAVFCLKKKKIFQITIMQ